MDNETGTIQAVLVIVRLALLILRCPLMDYTEPLDKGSADLTFFR